MPHLGLVIGQIDRIGGMEKQAALLSRELKDRSMEVTLFISGSKKYNRGTGSLDLESIARRYLFHSRYSRELSKQLLSHYCKRLRITHLIAFNVGNTEIAVTAGTDARVAMNVRGTKFSTDSRLAERYRKAAEKCDCLITNSSNTSELLQRSGVAGESRIRVIHNGIELPEIEPSPGDKMVLYVGSIKEVKDPMTFVRACHEIIKKDGEVRVVMAGDGNLRPLIENYISDNGLARNFTLLGEVPYGAIPYREASVFVNSSLRESSCNSLLEALSFGIPVVATANPGNSGVISDLEHHELVPVSNSEKMAEAIHSLLGAGPDRRKAIFEQSRNLIRERYSVSKMVDDYIESFLIS
jgi:glycosyltransferase involved in cell wall biosynthesis